MTTHYLDEAEQLADRLAVLREGVIIREGTPAELTGGSSETEVRYRKDGHEVVVRTTEPTKLLHRLTAEALAEGHELEGLSVRRPTLEDVYLSLTAEHRGVRLFRHQLKWEQRLFWRSREAAVFVFLFPILLFALLTAVYNGRIDGPPGSRGCCSPG